MSIRGTAVSNFVVVGTTLTITGVTVGGVDRELEVVVALNDPTFEVASVTWNGAEVLSRLRFRKIDTSNVQREELWGLTAPGVGTGSVVITFTGAVTATAVAQPWTSVNQLVPRTTSPIYRDGNASETNPRDTTGTGVTWGGGSDRQVYWIAIRDDTLTWTPDAGVTAELSVGGGGATNRMRLVLVTDDNTESGKLFGTLSGATSWNAIGYNLQASSTVATPTADFTGTPLSGVAPVTVAFTNASSDADSYVWDLDHPGGTVTSTDENPTYTYTLPGVYSVSLTATNPAGTDTLTRTAYVTVSAGIACGAGTFALSGGIANLSISTPTSLGTITSSTRPAGRQRLYVRASAVEANSADNITPTSGFGAFSAARSRDAAFAILARGEWTISTAASETSNPTLDVAGDRISLLSVLEESQDTALGLGAGTFTLTGQAATLTYGRQVALGAGTFALTGNPAVLTESVALELIAETGTFAFTGSDVTLDVTRPVVLGAGVFTFTGNVATIQEPREIIIAAGVFTLTGSDATLTHYIPVVGTGWRATVRALGPRWRIAWRPMSPATPFPVPVSLANDAGVILDEIEGYDVATGAPVVYEGGSIDAFWSATPDGSTPLGSITVTATRNASRPRFVVHFEAAQMTTVLTGRAADSAIYLVLVGSGNFRAAVEHIVRAALVLV